MKTQILDRYQPPKGWMISGVVALESDGYAVYRSASGSRFAIDIMGSTQRTIDVSVIVSDSQIKHHRLFGFAGGLALCDHNNSTILCWPDVTGDPLVVRIEQAPDSELEMRERCLAFASYEPTNRTLLLALNDNKGPAEIARYWAALDFEPDEMLQSGSHDVTVQWNKVRELDLHHYPATQLGDAPHEWLGISDIVKAGPNTYLHTVGGSHSRMRSGPEYEFSILSAYGDDSDAPLNLEVSEGTRKFSADQRLFIVKPKKRKCLLVYDLKEMALAYEVPLRPKQNTQGIDPGHGVIADIREDRLYIHSLLHLNVCRLLD